MRFFCHPNQPFRTVWDLVQVMLLLYLLVAVPLRVAFDVDVDFNTAAFWFDVCVDIYFIADVVLNFRTGFYHKNGILEIDLRNIAVEYAKTWLTLDVITCLPVTYVIMLIKWDADGSESSRHVKVFRVLRLLKLGKLLRVARILRMIERYREQLRIFMNAFGGIVLSIGIFFFSHIIACLWYYLGTIDQDEDLADRTPMLQGWVVREWGTEGDNGLQTCDQIAAGEEIPVSGANGTLCMEGGKISRYITALYWAMMTISTVGYGDVTAKTDLEKVGSCLAMLFGALVFAAITGQMASRFMATKGAIQAFNTKMDEVRQYLHDNNIPIGQRRAIEAHFQLLWDKTAIYDEREILGLLPRVLRDPIVESLYVGVVGHAAIFAPLHSETIPRGREVLVRIAQQLTHTVANFGLIVMMEGEYGQEMFFIEDGEVDVYRQTAESRVAEVTHSDFRTQLGVRLGRLGSQSFFGERAVMRRGNGLRRGVRTRTVVSRTACRFHVLHKRAVDALRAEIPVLENIMATVETGLPRSHGVMPQQLTPVATAAVDMSNVSIVLAQMRSLEQKTVRHNLAMEAKLDRALVAISKLAQPLGADRQSREGARVGV